HSPKVSQFTGAPGTLQRAGKHLGESQSTQSFLQPARIAFATLRERQIRKSSVLARDRPRGFPVSCQINDLKRLGHRLATSSFMCHRNMFVLKQRYPSSPLQNDGFSWH